MHTVTASFSANVRQMIKMCRLENDRNVSAKKNHHR